jgi:hypothetical protein
LFEIGDHWIVDIVYVIFVAYYCHLVQYVINTACFGWQLAHRVLHQVLKCDRSEIQAGAPLRFFHFQQAVSFIQSFEVLA